MSGSGLAPILIPIVGTMGLVAWLIIVYYVGNQVERAAGNPAAGQRSPAPAALAGRRQPGTSPVAGADPAADPAAAGPGPEGNAGTLPRAS